MPKSIQQKLDEGRQYRSFSGALELRSADGGKMIVEGYAATFGQPYQLWSYDGYTVMEQIDARAFDECDLSDVILQYDHQGRVLARGSNGTLSVSADAHGLHVRADLSGTAAGQQLYEEIKGGYVSRMSFGFKVGEDRREVTEDHEKNTVTVLRTITKIAKLYDVSAVSIPANDATEISARDCGGGVIDAVKEERLARKRALQKQKIKIITSL